ncbi:MAG: hypothetical protein KJO12_08140 [Ignavibacteria bacterium]|nr:hypothetical protein [Ignavibacteria bacterium]
MNKSIFIICCSVSIFLLMNQAKAQLAGSSAEPTDAKIVYVDVQNFIQAFKMLEADIDTVDVLQKEYINKGTPGLKIFIEKYGLSAEKLSIAIKKFPEDYKAIDDKLKWLKTQEDSIRQYFKKIKYFIPNSVFPPTYYLVDIRRGIGSGSIEGQLITIEKEAKRIIDPGLKTHIIHELVHLNQLNAIGSLEKYLAIYNTEKSLLAITIREGVAEFFADLVTGKYTQDEAYFYTRKHEEGLWGQFSIEMNGKETGDWMWKKPNNPEQPRDVGYVLGALIVENYYKKSLDINEVVSEILSITDYKEFLEKSEYASKFIQ